MSLSWDDLQSRAGSSPRGRVVEDMAMQYAFNANPNAQAQAQAQAFYQHQQQLQLQQKQQMNADAANAAHPQFGDLSSAASLGSTPPLNNINNINNNKIGPPINNVEPPMCRVATDGQMEGFIDRSQGGEGGKRGRLPTYEDRDIQVFEDFSRCKRCGKEYRQNNSLYKHLYEHHPGWNGVSKHYNLSKHQQVMMMQGAEVLLSFRQPERYFRAHPVRF